MGTASAQGISPRAIQDARAPMLRVAVAAHLAEVVGLLVAIVFGLVDSASGQSWTASNAAGFIVIEVIAAAAVGLLAFGIARVRPWSRTPAVMTQVFVILIAVWLLEAHRYAWGVPALVMAFAGLAGLFAPASLRALARQVD
jgi:cell shape-determining protein MreD